MTRWNGFVMAVAAGMALTSCGVNDSVETAGPAMEQVSQTLTTTETCGRNTCAPDQVCCNPSCGICTAPGETCTQIVCE